MSTQVQYRRGTATQNNAFVGALAEITVDTTNKTLRVHDGATAGGSNIATVSYVDTAISSLSANSITDGTSSVAIIATNGNIRANVAGSTVSTIYSGGVLVTGVVSATGNITGGNLSGTAITGTLSTAAQTNITSVGTLSSLSVSGNVQGGNLRTAGLISATGAITGAGITGTSLTVSTGNITGGNLLLSGAILDSAQLDIQTTASNANVVITPNGTGNLNVTTGISVTGNITAGNLSATGISGTLSTAAQTNITSVGTLSSLSVSGNVQGGNLRTAGLISATGTVTGTTFIGIANQAKYADLAEYYIADADYPVGTVLEFGGLEEVTQSSGSHVTSIAGTVSDRPAYIMNSDLDHHNRTPVALMGRVPCRVIGSIQKGDRLVASDIPGVATALDANLYQPGCIVGKALENYDSTTPGIIEVVVGRL